MSKLLEHFVVKSENTDVSKYVFTGSGVAVESVLYRYGNYSERTVICCSTMCGCNVGCVYCGTGEQFVRNLTAEEIIFQVDTVLEDIDCSTAEIKKFQIMFMSMGEPFLNWPNTKKAIEVLSEKYPTADLLISTSAPANLPVLWDDFIELSQRISKVGIQFSLHESNNIERAKLIPTRSLKVEKIAELGEKWALEVGRKPFFNYCAKPSNVGDSNISELLENYEPDVWEVTISVICEKDSTVKASIESQLDLINKFREKLVNSGYSVRVFNPAGQDDIGGGCGQLWYFQEWRKNNAGNH